MEVVILLHVLMSVHGVIFLQMLLGCMQDGVTRVSPTITTPGLKEGFGDFWRFESGYKGFYLWSGSTLVNSRGKVGTIGVADPSNYPPARQRGMYWMDSAKNLWLFGGGYDFNSTYHVYLNDIWKFDGFAWTWIGGSNNLYIPPSYWGSNPNPGGRSYCSFWQHSNGSVFLFGGRQLNSTFVIFFW